MLGSKKIVRGGPTMTVFFVCVFLLVYEGREDPDTTISRPSSAHQQNAIKMEFCRQPNIEFWLGTGTRTSITKKPYIFVIFRGGQDPLSTPPDPHMLDTEQSMY